MPPKSASDGYIFLIQLYNVCRSECVFFGGLAVKKSCLTFPPSNNMPMFCIKQKRLFHPGKQKIFPTVPRTAVIKTRIDFT